MPSDLLNTDTLSPFIEMGADVAGSLVELYIQQSSNEVKLIDDLLQKSDFEGARKVIHSLKGASFNTGAQKMGDLCLALEKSIKENDTTTLIKMAEQLPSVLAQTHQAFNELLSSLP